MPDDELYRLLLQKLEELDTKRASIIQTIESVYGRTVDSSVTHTTQGPKKTPIVERLVEAFNQHSNALLGPTDLFHILNSDPHPEPTSRNVISNVLCKNKGTLFVSPERGKYKLDERACAGASPRSDQTEVGYTPEDTDKDREKSW